MGSVARKFEVVEGGFAGSLVEANCPTKDLTKDPLRTDEKWLSTAGLASLAGIADRVARRAVDARRWRGCDLIVREVASHVGQGGKVLQVHVDSLPADLREAWYLARGVDVNARPEATALAVVTPAALVLDKRHDARLDVARWRHDVIRPVLALPKRSKAREVKVQELAALERLLPNGRRGLVSRATICRWVQAYEAKQAGLAGLMPKENARKGTRDVTVTRTWDSFFEGRIPQADHARIADQLQAHIRNLWASGERGKYAVSEKATSWLVELSAALGVKAFDRLPQGRITGNSGAGSKLEVCFVNTRRVEEERRFGLLAVKDKDNARWQDEFMPHIRRDYSGYLPRDIVVGDVHPVDVLMNRRDGTEVYARAISWFDIATNEIHMTFVILEPGEGVKREHVAMAFEAMVTDWGLPRLLYLDNGSEYGWAAMVNGFTHLSKLTSGAFALHQLGENGEVDARVRSAREAVVRSLAYNAKGKPGIEGTFGNLERVQFAVISGWTSGDRMRKKTHAKGRPAKPFEGTAEDFLRDASTMLQFYHKRAQDGKLGGRSPNEALADFIAGGWGKTVLGDPAVLRLAFSEEVTRTPSAGRFRIKNRHGDTVHYYHEALELRHSPVTVRIPAWKPDVVFVFDGETFLCEATVERAYGVLERAGAEELGRRRKYVLREVAEMRKHCALLDLVAETERHNSHLLDTPDAPVGTLVNTDMLSRMSKADAEARDRLSGNAQTPRREITQFKVGPNAALAAVAYEDDEE